MYIRLIPAEDGREQVAVRKDDDVAAAALIGLSGQCGLAPEPLLTWRVYLHGVPVDPLVLGPRL